MYKRIMTLQDISCVGQCSGSVALPIISACGHECCLLPSAVLSTHTGGFTGYTFCDLTEEIPKIQEHWRKEGIRFDCIYTGYLGSQQQIDDARSMFEDRLAPSGVKVVDPAMADNGTLYYGFDQAFATAMGKLCAAADIVLPNITEACFMTGMEYKEVYDQDYVMEVLAKLTELGCRTIILTGISYREGYTGVVVYEKGAYAYYEHEKISQGCHGTGDVYASAFVGALMQGVDAMKAARIAADYTVECIKVTIADQEGNAAAVVGGKTGHWYGVEFERRLGYLIRRLEEETASVG